MAEPEVLEPQTGGPATTTKRPKGVTLRRLIAALWVIGGVALGVGACRAEVRRRRALRDLEDTGRILQSAFNEGRRGAITTRTDHYLAFRRKSLEGGRESCQLTVFAQGGQGNPVAFGLPPGVMPVLRVESRRHTPGVDEAEGCGLPLFPFPDFEGEIFANGAPITGPDAPIGWVVIHPDGTVELTAPAEDQAIPPSLSLEQAVARGVLTDLKLTDPSAPGAAVFIDIVPNTGRVRFEVLRSD